MSHYPEQDAEEFLRWALRSPYRQALKRILKAHQRAFEQHRENVYEHDYWQALGRVRHCALMMGMNAQIRPTDLEGRTAANRFWVGSARQQLIQAREIRVLHPRRLP
jgi:hypothetical protein